MLTLCASVYFHTKFGINLTDKSAGAGLTMAFLMSSLSLVGGILTNKKDGISFETEGSLEPLINLKEDRQKQNLEAQKEITVGEAMEKDLEDLYPNKVAAHQSSPSPQQNNNNTVQQSAEDKKLWGWGHGINNNKR